MNKRVIYPLIIILFYLGERVTAQSLPVGMQVLEDVYRREQLTKDQDSLISFTVRPLFTGYSYDHQDELLDTIKKNLLKIKHNISWANNKGTLQLLPLSWQHQYNSKIPYGWNDGAMVPARGNQSLLSFGAYARYGKLSIQLKPEYVYAENLKFDGLPTDHYDVVWAKYYRNYFNVTDLPERFGETSFKKLFWGQSSIRFSHGPLSVGISNENLHWGPGIRSSLLMSNNAPGFKHITLNTTKPVETSIGSFEGQMLLGKLTNSGFLPPEPNRVFQGNSLYIQKQNDWRYLSGFVLSYNPKWIPGLFLGTARTSQVYHSDLGDKIGDYIPLLQPFEKKKETLNREYLSSMFIRWNWHEAKMEVYGEYGHNTPRKLKEFFVQPEKYAGYLWGFRKLFDFNRRRQEFLQIGMEFTELQQTAVPEYGGWYTSVKIREGYTNNGQLLGAAIGPGSNLQSLDISWVKGIKRIGFQVERFTHNNDLYYQIFTESQDFRKHWIDMSYSLSADWDYKNLIVSAKGTMIRAMNYHYVLFNRPPEYFVPGWDILNYQVRLGITYRF